MNRHLIVIVFWCSLLPILSFSSVVQAQQAPDLVVLRDGSMMRGTISEYDHDKGVTIQLVSGELRSVEASEIEYAGPADRQPKSEPAAVEAAPPPAAPVVTEPPQDEPNLAPVKTADPAKREDQLRVKLRSSPPGLTFHRNGLQFTAQTTQDATVGSFSTELCTAPCEISLPPGGHTLALSKPNRAPRQANAIELREDSTIEGRIKSRAGARLAFGIAAGAALVTGTILFTSTDPDDREMKTASMALVPVGGGLAIGAVLTRDKPVVRVLPYGAVP